MIDIGKIILQSSSFTRSPKAFLLFSFDILIFVSIAKHSRFHTQLGKHFPGISTI